VETPLQGSGLPPVADAAAMLRLSEAGALARRGTPAEAAKEFERLFATLLVKEMRATLPEGFFGEGAGSDVFDGWFDEHLGSALAEGQGLGMRVALERDLGLKQAQRNPGKEQA
jgi:Rod binding domain-containing protein